MKWPAILLVLLAGCVTPGHVGPCGVNEPSDAGHLTYDLDPSLSADYSIGNGTIGFLQVADGQQNPTPNTREESVPFSDDGCVWFTVPDGIYNLNILIPNNAEGARGFFEEDVRVLARGDFNFTLGFHNG
jgi:hypothetical protein